MAKIILEKFMQKHEKKLYKGFSVFITILLIFMSFKLLNDAKEKRENFQSQKKKFIKNTNLIFEKNESFKIVDKELKYFLTGCVFYCFHNIVYLNGYKSHIGNSYISPLTLKPVNCIKEKLYTKEFKIYEVISNEKFKN